MPGLSQLHLKILLPDSEKLVCTFLTEMQFPVVMMQFLHLKLINTQ